MLKQISFIKIEIRHGNIWAKLYVPANVVRLKALAFFKAIEAGLNGLEQGQRSLLNIRVSVFQPIKFGYD